jgi:hypothetical protein
LFPAIAALSTSIPFVFFSLMMMLQFVLVLWFLPETRGVALEQMAATMAPSAAAAD